MHPSRAARQVDTHLLADMPCVVATVLAATGHEQVHWVGHSMGGMLGVGAVSRGLPCAEALRTITLMGEGGGGVRCWGPALAAGGPWPTLRHPAG